MLHYAAVSCDVFGPPAMRGGPRGIRDDLWPSHSEAYGRTVRFGIRAYTELYLQYSSHSAVAIV